MAKKQKRKQKTKRVKAGTSRAAAKLRKLKFAQAYLANGFNAEQAAISAGLSPKTARSSGQRMLTDVVVRHLISEATEKAAQIAGLSVERTLKEVARLAYSDPRRFYDGSGNLLAIHELPDDVAATIASIEHEEIFSGLGEEREQTGLLKKLKVWDKNSALEKAMKYHGLYEKDNEQGKTVVVMAPPPYEKMRETLRAKWYGAPHQAEK